MSTKLLAAAFAAVIAGGLLAGCAGGGSSASGAAASESASSAGAEAAAAESASAAASTRPEGSGEASAAATYQEVIATGEAITADMIAEGTYDIDVQSSSSMFRITSCQLTVADGQMTAVLNLSGDGYEKLYMGTGEEADAAGEGAWALWTDDDADGKYSYTVPVKALDVELDCAAWSFRRERWYDRTVVFDSANIPAEAISR